MLSFGQQQASYPRLHGMPCLHGVLCGARLGCIGSLKGGPGQAANFAAKVPLSSVEATEQNAVMLCCLQHAVSSRQRCRWGYWESFGGRQEG